MHRLYLIGAVNDEAYERFSKELRVLELKKVKYAELEIVSEGGDADTGLAFYGRIISSSVKLKAIGYGIVQSAAMLVFAACQDRVCTPECMFMVHNSRDRKEGDHRDHERISKQLKQSEDLWATLLSRHSNGDKDEWLRMSDNETYLTAENAADLGLVSKILGE